MTPVGPVPRTVGPSVAPQLLGSPSLCISVDRTTNYTFAGGHAFGDRSATPFAQKCVARFVSDS